MSRDLNHLASLNTVDNDNSPREEQKRHEEELQMFSNTTFFDLDMGKSTDIATTVDELLMQQEKQIQYPQKQQPLEELGPVAGPSYSHTPNSLQSSHNVHRQQSQQSQQQQQHLHDQQHQNVRIPLQQPQRNIPFDMTTLQGFSLAGELPQTTLSIYDVDPMFHSGHPAEPQHHQHHHHNHQHHHQDTHDLHEELKQHHQISRPPVVQRHEVADHFAPPEPPKGVITPTSDEDDLEGHHSRKHSIVGGGLDEEKRRRNTAASARFRIKKKLREQEMEKNQKVMQQKLADQAERIKHLEMENKWLKNLVVEKNNASNTTSLGKLREEFMKREQE